MVQNIIVAEKVYSEYKSSEVWEVAVRIPSGKKIARRLCVEPLKAIRYMLLLRKRLEVKISKVCMDMVKQEHEAIKAAKDAARVKEENKHLYDIAQNLLAKDAERKAPTRRTPSFDLDEVERKLDEAGVNFIDIYSENLFVCVNISWGDWKHDHLLCRHIMQQLGYNFVSEEVTEEDGSDAYSAVHYYN